LPSSEAEEYVATLKREKNMDSSIVGEVVEEPLWKIRIL
jgi:hydrogenase maturation factor